MGELSALPTERADPRGAFERILPSEQMLVLLSFYTSISTKYNASGKHEPAGEILLLPKKHK